MFFQGFLCPGLLLFRSSAISSLECERPALHLAPSSHQKSNDSKSLIAYSEALLPRDRHAHP